MGGASLLIWNSNWTGYLVIHLTILYLKHWYLLDSSFHTHGSHLDTDTTVPTTWPVEGEGGSALPDSPPECMKHSLYCSYLPQQSLTACVVSCGFTNTIPPASLKDSSIFQWYWCWIERLLQILGLTSWNHRSCTFITRWSNFKFPPWPFVSGCLNLLNGRN